MDYKVEVRYYDGSDPSEYRSYDASLKNLEDALEATRNMVEMLVKSEGFEQEALQVSEKMFYKLKEALVREGVMPDKEKTVTFSVSKNRKSRMDYLTDELDIPKMIGGLPLAEVKQYRNYAVRLEVWKILWSDGDENIETELTLAVEEMQMEFLNGVLNRLRDQLKEKVALLRMRYPGDFEVVCHDATGQEDRFDEGCTYLAENHIDTSLVWVYDRYGERREYAWSRFEAVRVKVDVKKLEPRIPGNYTVEWDSLGGETGKWDDPTPEGLKRVLEMMNQELGR